QAFFLVHQREASIAQPVVEDEVPLAELFGATQAGDRIVREGIGIVGGLNAVLDPLAFLGELRMEPAVIELERVEVAIRGRDHLLARYALIERHVGEHQRTRCNVAVDAGERAEIDFTADDRLSFGNAAVLYPQPQSHDGRNAVDRKSTRLNSSHVKISYAVFCLKKKKNK